MSKFAIALTTLVIFTMLLSEVTGCFAQGPQRGPRGSGRGGGGRGGGGRTADSLKVGDMAPDFELKSLDGQQTVKLSSYRDEQPVALIFGSYT